MRKNPRDATSDLIQFGLRFRERLDSFAQCIGDAQPCFERPLVVLEGELRRAHVRFENEPHVTRARCERDRAIFEIL